MGKPDETTKFVETPPLSVEAAPAAPAVVATVTAPPVPVAAGTAPIPAHAKLWLDAAQLAKDAKALAIDVEVLVRGAFQHTPD